MDLTHYEYFIMIAEQKVLSKAAEKLHVSPSVLSRYIRKKEDELSVKLFVTENGKYVTTKAGEIYLSACRKLQSLKTGLQRSLSIEKGAAITQIRIGMSPFQGGLMLSYVYPRILRLYPDLNLEIINENGPLLLNKLQNGDCDVIYTVFPSGLLPQYRQFRFLPVERKRLLLGVPSLSNAFAFGGSAAAPAPFLPEYSSLLSGTQFILRSGDTLVGRISSQILTEYKISADILLSISNNVSYQRLLSEGTLAGFLLESDAFAHPDLRYFSFSGEECSFAAGFLLPDGHLTDPVRNIWKLERERLETEGSSCLTPLQEAI